MTTKLEQELSKLKQGNHICLIYENVLEQMAAVVPFFKEGLARRERCVYIADEHPVEDVARALAAVGVAVVAEQERGALHLLTQQDAYLQGGKFAPSAMIDFLRSLESQALADGFSGVRVAGEMTWALGPEIGCDRLIEYEVLLNDFVANSRCTIICQYHLSRFDPAIIHDVLRTHPIAILGDLVCPNPYYEPPELVLSPEAEPTAEFKRKRVAWWVAQLKRVHAAEQERELTLEKLRQSERRLAEAQQVAHIGSWERDLRTNHVTWSAELYRLFGLPADGGVSYLYFLSLLSPQDVERVRMLADEAVRQRRPFNCDYRLTRPDGSVRVVNDQGTVILNEAGEPIRLVGTAQDVTELRRVEQERSESARQLQALSRRLLEVQEEERRHLARELHDEVGQLLTGLHLLLKPTDEATPEPSQPKLDQAQPIVDQLLEKVRGLSFDLRPAVLDQLGLVPALLELFQNYTKQTGVRVNFKHKDAEKRFAPEVETAAYRIVQEGLTNVARHAGVGEVAVRVWATPSILSVQIEDAGRGFDPQAVGSARSHGLSGMRERVLLLQGQLTLDARPGAGAQITAELPLGGSSREETR